MTDRLLLFASLVVLGGCAHGAEPDLPTCDGAARRPANPHGSILSPSAPAPVSPAAPAQPAEPGGGCA